MKAIVVGTWLWLFILHWSRNLYPDMTWLHFVPVVSLSRVENELSTDHYVKRDERDDILKICYITSILIVYCTLSLYVSNAKCAKPEAQVTFNLLYAKFSCYIRCSMLILLSKTVFMPK